MAILVIRVVLMLLPLLFLLFVLLYLSCYQNQYKDNQDKPYNNWHFFYCIFQFINSRTYVFGFSFSGYI